MKGASKPRVRFRLLVLLWIWVGCIALVLDLFFNVQELDGIRPRARLYRATRYVAHRMIGQPIYEDEFMAESDLLRRRRYIARTTEPAASELPGLLSARPSLRPIPGTLSGARLFEGLRRAALRGDADPARRRGAMRTLARLFGPQARPTLEQLTDEPMLRAEAKRLLRTTNSKGARR